MKLHDLTTKQKILLSVSLLLWLLMFITVWNIILINRLTVVNGFGLEKLFNLITLFKTHFTLTLPLEALIDGYAEDVGVSFISTLIISSIITAVIIMGKINADKRKNLFGDAKFSDEKTIKKLNLRADKGIIVGKDKNGLLRFGGVEFANVGAPTRSGKGVAIVIPNLLEWQNSCVVLDVKQECFEITSAYRALAEEQGGLGQQVYLFDPFSFNTHRYNPLDYLDFSPENPGIELQITALAESLYPSTGKGGSGEFFTLQSRSIFSAIVFLLGKLRGAGLLASSFTLTTLAGALQGVRIYTNDKDLSQSEIVPLAELITTANNMELLTDTVYSKFQSFLEQAEATDQFAGVKGSYEAPLKVFQDRMFELATSCNDFDFRDLRKNKITIYIGIKPENLQTARPILNLFFTQLIYENIRQGLPDTNPELKHNVLLLMDEFTSVGYMGQYRTAVAYMAGYGLRSLIIYQSRTQLAENPPDGYGDKGAETLLDNHACQVIYRPKQVKIAEDISKQIGNTMGINRSHSGDNMNILKASHSDQKIARALVLPQEIMEMADDEEFIFCNGSKIKCKKAYFYNDHYFINKLKLVSPYLRNISGIPTKEELETAYQSKETSIPLPDQRSNFRG